MMTDEKIIELLAEHEQAIGNLYMEFADLFPEWKEFWTRCAKEEFHHAQMIRSMLELLKKQQIQYIGKFKAPVIETSLNFIGKETLSAQDKQIFLKKAFSTAWSLECSLIENRYYESFDTNDLNTLADLRVLRDDTTKHKKMIATAMEKIG